MPTRQSGRTRPCSPPRRLRRAVVSRGAHLARLRAGAPAAAAGAAGACCSSIRSRSIRRRAWLMRCDRVDFAPGGVAPRHGHRGGGIRCLLRGSLTVTVGDAPGTPHAAGRLLVRERPRAGAGPGLGRRRTRPSSAAPSCPRRSAARRPSSTWTRRTPRAAGRGRILSSSTSPSRHEQARACARGPVRSPSGPSSVHRLVPLRPPARPRRAHGPGPPRLLRGLRSGLAQADERLLLPHAQGGGDARPRRATSSGWVRSSWRRRRWAPSSR